MSHSPRTESLSEKRTVHYDEAASRQATLEYDGNVEKDLAAVGPTGAEGPSKFQVIQEEAVRAEDFEHSLTNWEAISLYRKVSA